MVSKAPKSAAEALQALLPGLLLVGLLAACSKLISAAVEPWLSLEALTVGIILGVAVANTVGVRPSMRPGITLSLKKLLKLGIVLLGFKLNFAELAELGPRLLLSVLLWVPLILVAAYQLGRRFGLHDKLGVLIGVGSSICGASAIVAVAPSIKAEDEDALMAVGVVSLLGAVGVLAYSAVAAISPMSDAQYGLWSGLTLQGVAHALAGAFARGEAAGELGTVIKMARVLMLAPMTVGLVLFFSAREGEQDASQPAWKIAAKGFPMYVLYFILAGVLRSLGLLPEALVKTLGAASGLLILMAMIAMGLMVHISTLRKKGGPALLMGSALFLGLSAVGYGLVITVF